MTWTQTVWLWLRTHGLRLLLIGVGAYLAVRLLRRLTRQLGTWLIARQVEADPLRRQEWEQRARTIQRVLDGLVLFLVVVVAGTMALWELGIQVGPLLAGAGVVGVALSLGTQTLVRDIWAGLFILLEDQFAIGDVIEVAGVSGTVEEMTLRATTLRDLDGTVHIVSNGEMRVVSNKTRDWARVLLRVGVAYESDLERTIAVLEEVGRELAADPVWQQEILEEPQVSGVDDLRESDIALLLLVKTVPGRQWAVARELRRRVVETLTREGIEMPYPTQVHLTRLIGGEGPGEKPA